MSNIPPMLIRYWKGGDAERFKHTDMARIEANINKLAELSDVPTVNYTPKTRASQFNYSEYQKAEDEVKAIADKRNVPVSMETMWGKGRTVNYADFERLEREFYKVYRTAGGRSERIGWDEDILFIDWLISPDDWQGGGPFTCSLDSDFVKRSDDMVAYIPEGVSDESAADAANAVLTVSCERDGRVDITALSLKPTHDIHIRVTTRVFKMNETKTLSSTGWQGSGPWTQSITLTDNIASGIITPAEGMTSQQAQAYANAGISISETNGRTVKIRALFEKPNINLNVIVLYENTQGA